MADYFGTSINESPTIVLPAAERIENARGIALIIDTESGGLKKPTAGDLAIGISLLTMEETIEQGEDVTIQVKDIGKWIASGEIAAGDLLAADENGKAKKAGSGEFIMAQALSPAEKDGTIIKVQIIKAGYPKE